MKVLLGSGRLVTLFPEYGPDATMRAAEISEASANMSLLEKMHFNIATVLVAVKYVQDEITPEVTDDNGVVTTEATYGSAMTQEAIVGDAQGADSCVAFRKHFTDEEWEQLGEAVNKAYQSPKSGKAFKLLK